MLDSFCQVRVHRHLEEAAPRPSRRMGNIGAAWFETREDALLTMRKATITPGPRI